MGPCQVSHGGSRAPWLQPSGLEEGPLHPAPPGRGEPPHHAPQWTPAVSFGAACTGAGRTQGPRGAFPQGVQAELGALCPSLLCLGFVGWLHRSALQRLLGGVIGRQRRARVEAGTGPGRPGTPRAFSRHSELLPSPPPPPGALPAAFPHCDYLRPPNMVAAVRSPLLPSGSLPSAPLCWARPPAGLATGLALPVRGRLCCGEQSGRARSRPGLSGACALVSPSGLAGRLGGGRRCRPTPWTRRPSRQQGRRVAGCPASLPSRCRWGHRRVQGRPPRCPRRPPPPGGVQMGSAASQPGAGGTAERLSPEPSGPLWGVHRARAVRAAQQVRGSG